MTSREGHTMNSTITADEIRIAASLGGVVTDEQLREAWEALSKSTAAWAASSAEHVEQMLEARGVEL